MKKRVEAGPQTIVRGALTGAVNCFLFCCLAVPPGVAAPVPAQHSHKPARLAPLTRDQRIEQALNRFTFGPRPGEVEDVRRVGLGAWFEQQLHPASLPDAGLDARLAEFPAMQLSQAELLARFPAPGVLRAFSRGDVNAPADPVEAAIYADAALKYREKLEAKQAALSSAPAKPAAPQPLDALASQSLPGVPLSPGGPQPAPPASPKTVLKAPPMNEATAEAIVALPPQPRMERLLALSPEGMQGLHEALKGGEQMRLLRGLSPVQREQAAAMGGPEKVVAAEVTSVRLLRDVYSQRQLQAVMTDFWLNHFNVYLRKNQREPYFLPAYERETILPHALGRFEDLLVATAESPAMLEYLDNAGSIGPDSRAAGRGVRSAGDAQPGKAVPKVPRGINENYARELMELHTLGVNGGYTQADVIEVAKCFTGWTVARPDQGGTFTFNPNRHEPGPKTVMGHLIPEGGENEGLQVLHILASSPATAHFLSQQLAERFVSDTPPSALVNRMAAAYMKSDGDIATVLTTMFRSPEFWSPGVFRAKLKTPVEFVASALRASDADVTNPVPLVQALGRLGMPMYGMQTPNGYSWQADAWVSSGALLSRMNFALLLSGNRLPGTRVNWGSSLGLDPRVVPDEGSERRVELALLGQPAAKGTRAAVLAETANPTAQASAEQSFRASTKPAGFTPGVADEPGLTRVRAARARPVDGPESPLPTTAGLLLGSPDFQKR